MILYHFVNLKFGLENIAKRRLKVSRVKHLNDPFEFQAFDLTDREFRKSIRAGIDEIHEQCGLICFSKSWRSPLQWAHYADRHTGICLGLEILPEHEDIIKEVIYVPERLRVNMKNVTEELIKQLIRTKFDKWRYEEECRIFVPLEQAEQDGLYFTPFESNMELKEIYIGASCDVTKEALKTALGDLKDTVKIIKTRAGFSQFEMVEDKRYSPVEL